MKLHWSPRSPFVRKVMIVLHETGQLDEVTLVRSVVAAHLPPNPAVLADNPLGKIPTLLTGDGRALFDSRVICEHLDLRAGGALLPASGPARDAQLRWQALADGLTEILLTWRTEMLRPGGPWPSLTGGWAVKVRAAMACLEAEADTLGRTPFGLGQIAVVCALGQLDFRWADAEWRGHFPRLAALAADWAARPSVAATAVVNDADEGPEPAAGQLRFDAPPAQRP
ncbi:glutathione S-transferase [Frigidibacter oleivorans]|uniref:glutathione S-transferase n=1 Tax=Frigidibacter oleivorans TaxID=2487129 RepID=UPI000F8CC1BB|nr:glutathione S-transferase N-terminal domain-containing protein [Frigidibacter oleivorans]